MVALVLTFKILPNAFLGFISTLVVLPFLSDFIPPSSWHNGVMMNTDIARDFMETAFAKISFGKDSFSCGRRLCALFLQFEDILGSTYFFSIIC